MKLIRSKSTYAEHDQEDLQAHSVPVPRAITSDSAHWWEWHSSRGRWPRFPRASGRHARCMNSSSLPSVLRGSEFMAVKMSVSGSWQNDGQAQVANRSLSQAQVINRSFPGFFLPLQSQISRPLRSACGCDPPCRISFDEEWDGEVDALGEVCELCLLFLFSFFFLSNLLRFFYWIPWNSPTLLVFVCLWWFFV